MPSISSSGNSSPQSTATRSSPDSMSIMLSPISPRPPSGMRRTAGADGASTGTGSWRYAVITAEQTCYHPGPEPTKNRDAARRPRTAAGPRGRGAVDTRGPLAFNAGIDERRRRAGGAHHTEDGAMTDGDAAPGFSHRPSIMG